MTDFSVLVKSCLTLIIGKENCTIIITAVVLDKTLNTSNPFYHRFAVHVICIKDWVDKLKPVRLAFVPLTAFVYFDQQRHACACICVVKNKENHWKIMKKVLFSSWAQEAHIKLMLVSDWEWFPKAGCSYFFNDFPMFFIVFDHAQACVCWSKYTTNSCQPLSTLWNTIAII